MTPYLSVFLGLVLLFLVVELVLHILISNLSKRYDLILTRKDKVPKLDKNKLKRFLEMGYDSELGWVRKPNVSKTENSFDGEKSWHINSKGSRINPGHEHLKTKIISFGDSFTFNREVNDDETWQYYLADLIDGNVANFGVGNYGLDQAFLRFKREIKNYKDAKLIVVGVVPDTIVRDLSVWKHYSEFGNTFGFKPRFMLERGELKLIKNPANKKEDFYNLKKIIPIINKHDYFYESFKMNLFIFPYTISILKNPRKKLFLLFVSGLRYFFELLNIDWRRLKSDKIENAKKKVYNFIVENRVKGYKDKEIRNLTISILKEFAKTSNEKKVPILFLLMPQKEDLDYIMKKGIYYKKFIEELKKFMDYIDLGERFMELQNPLSIFPSKKYSNKYEVFGGHYNKAGNKIIAKEIKKFIDKKKVFKS